MALRGLQRSRGPAADIRCMHAKLLQLCLTFYDPMDCSLPVSSVHGILQARILEWVAVPSPGDPPDLGIEPRFPAGRFFTILWDKPIIRCLPNLSRICDQKITSSKRKEQIMSSSSPYTKGFFITHCSHQPTLTALWGELRMKKQEDFCALDIGPLHT